MGIQFSREARVVAASTVVIGGMVAYYALQSGKNSNPPLAFEGLGQETSDKAVLTRGKTLSAIVPLEQPASKPSSSSGPRRVSQNVSSAGPDVGSGAPGNSPRYRVTPDRKELGKHGFVDKYRVDSKRGEPQEFEWVVVNRSANKLEFTLDFTGSENFNFPANMVATTIVNAYEEKSVSHLKQVDLSKAWGLKLKQKLTPLGVDSAALDELQRKQQAEIQAEIEALDQAGITSRSTIQDIVVRDLKFVDKEFPPKEESLWDHNAVKENPFKGVHITWRRAHEFLGEDVQVFYAGISPMDIAQGRLGNCWFLCAVACLAENEKLITHIFDDETEAANKAGVYRVKLCVAGEWVDVTVDDFIPCYPGQGPVFSQNRGPELWVMLLEKAYAKVHGSYYTLASGNPSRALQDLTGCPVEYYWFEDEATKALIQSGEFVNKLLNLGESDQLTAAGTSGEDRYTALGLDPNSGPGLVAGHAYTVLNVKRACGVTLLQLRNPWGRFEWNGDYGDTSNKWTEEMKAEFKPTFAPDDGEFWMCYEDFLKHFCSLNVGYRRSPTGREWSEWRKKVTFTVQDGEANVNTFVEFKVPASAYAFIAVHQQDTRVPGTEAYADQGLFVCKRNGAALEIVGSAQLDPDRDAQVGVALEPGTYVVIPYSSGANMTKNKQQSKSVNVSIHVDRQEVVPSIHEIASDRQAFLDVLVSHLAVKGKEQKLAKGMSLYTGWDGEVFWIVGRRTAEFKAAPLELTVDTSNSKNAHSHVGSLKGAPRLFKAPGSTVVFHALCAMDTEQSMTASMSAASKYVS